MADWLLENHQTIMRQCHMRIKISLIQLKIKLVSIWRQCMGPNSTPGKLETKVPMKEATSRIVNCLPCLESFSHDFKVFSAFLSVRVTVMRIEFKVKPRNSKACVGIDDNSPLG